MVCHRTSKRAALQACVRTNGRTTSQQPGHPAEAAVVRHVPPCRPHTSCSALGAIQLNAVNAGPCWPGAASTAGCQLQGVSCKAVGIYRATVLPQRRHMGCIMWAKQNYRSRPASGFGSLLPKVASAPRALRLVVLAIAARSVHGGEQNAFVHTYYLQTSPASSPLPFFPFRSFHVLGGCYTLDS